MHKTARYLCMNDSHAKKGDTNEFLLNWEEAFEICEKEGIETILFGGDMFHSSASQSLEVLLAVKDVLIQCEKRGIKVLAVWGNHDITSKDSEVSYLHIYEPYKALVLDKYICLDKKQDDFKLHMMSYALESGKFQEELAEVKKNLSSSQKNILYIHEGINGGLGADNVSNKELPTGIFDEFDKVLCGHYHNRTKIPNTDIEYIGSSRQMNFGEDEEKGYTIIYSDGSTKFVKNEKNLRYITIEKTFEELDDDLLDQIAELYDDWYSVRLVIHCKKSQVSSVDKSKYLNANAAKVVIKTENEIVTKAEQSAFHRYDKNGIVNAYGEFCEGKDLSPQFGLKYIEQIN